jgi:hypothetical protein
MRLRLYDKADEPRSTVKAQLELPQADPHSSREEGSQIRFWRAGSAW